jgi:hypothetical protein
VEEAHTTALENDLDDKTPAAGSGYLPTFGGALSLGGALGSSVYAGMSGTGSSVYAGMSGTGSSVYAGMSGTVGSAVGLLTTKSTKAQSLEEQGKQKAGMEEKEAACEGEEVQFAIAGDAEEDVKAQATHAKVASTDLEAAHTLPVAAPVPGFTTPSRLFSASTGTCLVCFCFSRNYGTLSE